MSKDKPAEKNARQGAQQPIRIEPWVRSAASRNERKEAGRKARGQAPLGSHAKFSPPASGRDVIKILEKSNIGRVPELIPVRYGRMLASPFTFFRGTAALMARDLAESPKSGFIVQACGDCHIHNFGAFATPERKLLVDINDFDETLPAPWEWDLKRLAASLVLAAQANGFSDDHGQSAALTMARAYREHMQEMSHMSTLEVWYSHVTVGKVMADSVSETRRRMQKLLKASVEKSSPEAMMQKLTVLSKGVLRFKDIPPLLYHQEDVKVDADIRQIFEMYRKTLSSDRRVLLDKFELVDIARKVVGIGSVGTACGVVLLAGSDSDLLVLQVKEARASVLEPYAGVSRYEHNGERVVSGQRLMQAASDLFLGWTTGRKPKNTNFYLRQLHDVKIGVNTAYWTKEDYKPFSRLAGEILARAHARSGDAATMRGYLGKSSAFEEAIAKYALSYARQTELDYQQFFKACKSGTLKAQSVD